MKKSFLLCVVVFLSQFLSEAEEFVIAKVSPAQLNVRVLPSTSQTVVAKIAKGTDIKIFSIKDGWCQIEAPQDSLVWIASSDIAEDGSVLRDSFLRPGSEITHSPYSRKAMKNEKLTVLERKSDWTKVKAPPGLFAWVSREFLILSEEDVKKITQRIEALPEAKTDEINFEYVDLPDKNADYEGFLTLIKNAESVKHALVLEVNGSLAPICYLYSQKLDLQPWINKKIKVSGNEKWVKGWKRPLLIVEKIEKYIAE